LKNSFCPYCDTKITNEWSFLKHIQEETESCPIALPPAHADRECFRITKWHRGMRSKATKEFAEALDSALNTTDYGCLAGMLAGWKVFVTEEDMEAFPFISALSKKECTMVHFGDNKLITVEGYTVNAKNMREGFKYIGFDSSYVFSSVDGVLNFEAKRRMPAVTQWNGGNHQKEFQEAAANVLYDAFPNRNIVINVAHDSQARLNTDPRYYQINIWSVPQNAQRRSARAPSKMWGHRVPCTDGYEPCYDLYQITSSEGNEVAGCDPNNLYIYHDCCHEGLNSEVEIFQKILEGAVAAHKAKYEMPVEYHENSYVALCVKRIEIEGREAEDKIARLSGQIKDYQTSLVSSIREIEHFRQRKNELEKIGSTDKSKFTKEFHRLLDIAHVKKVFVRSNRLAVKTDMIKCTDPRPDDDGNTKEHLIGEFVITIIPDSGEVRFYNQSWTVVGYEEHMNAPHVFHDGRPCMGSIERTLPELVARYDFTSAFTVAINFLESVNVEDAAGKYIRNWPTKDTEGHTHKPNNPISYM